MRATIWIPPLCSVFSNALSHMISCINMEEKFRIWIMREVFFGWNLCVTQNSVKQHHRVHHTTMGSNSKFKPTLLKRLVIFKKNLKFTQIHTQLNSYMLRVTLKGPNSGGSWDSNTIPSKSRCRLLEPLDLKSGCIKIHAFYMRSLKQI